ncbi:MAG: pyridoxal phosphate-dependent aminotransferase [Lachnospiraceae bacterium]|nr:pyridoxal phosphate-dependent aminotransferase [Candidatus Minthocola equi]
MNEIRRSDKLAQVNYAVRGPLLDAANELEKKGVEILKLNIGNPGPFGYYAPDPLVARMQDTLEASEGYSDSKGILPAREAVLEYCKTKNLPNICVDEIYLGNGASELITMTLNALVNPGDEVLVPAPDYPLWTASVNLAGGRAVHYICDEAHEWMPDLADIEAKINEHTKAIVVINPNNPTGAIYSDDILKAIVELARKNNLIILADEIYDRLLLDDRKHTSIASLAPDLFCVTFNGLSKSHLVCGYRVGWMCISGDKSHAEDFITGLNVLSSMRLCANVPAQNAIPVALADPFFTKPMLAPGGRFYEQRKAVVDTIAKIDGMSVVPNKAAFYMFPKIDTEMHHINDDNKFALDFLNAKHVLIVSGTGFNWPAPDHFRVVCLPEASVLSEAMNRLGDFLADYKQY